MVLTSRAPRRRPCRFGRLIARMRNLAATPEGRGIAVNEIWRRIHANATDASLRWLWVYGRPSCPLPRSLDNQHLHCLAASSRGCPAVSLSRLSCDSVSGCLATLSRRALSASPFEPPCAVRASIFGGRVGGLSYRPGCCRPPSLRGTRHRALSHFPP